MRRMPFGRELHAPFALLDEARLLEHPRQLRELLQRTRRVVAEEVADPVEVDLGELAGVGRVAHQVLERVDVAELVEQAAHPRERERLVAAEAHPLAPTHLRERVAQVLAELVHLPAQVHVVEERVGELLELRALLGAHRVEQLLHLRHRLRHLLEQLVERLRVAGEEVAEAIHEALEVGLLAALALLEHLVELGEHVLHARELLGRHLRHALLELVEHRVEELLLQLLHQLLEALPRRVVHPVVLLELAHAAREIGRELLELLAALLREIFEELLAALVARGAGLVDAPVDALALLVDDLVELAGDVLVDAAEVVAVELLAAPLAQLLEHLAHAADVTALAVAEALLHHPPQRRVEVAVIEEIVGHLLQQRVGVEVEPDLRAVPARVLEPRAMSAR